MKLEILSIFWGEKFIESFRRTALRSLAFKGNKKSIYDQKTRWNVFTEPQFFDYVSKIIDAEFPELEVNIQSTVKLRTHIDMNQSAIIWQIEECMKNKTKLILAPPDTIFGDKTVGNLLTIGAEEGACVVVPHPRVHPTILEDLQSGITYSNPELVTMAWKHLHRSWEDAEEGHPRQNGFVGGVWWNKLEEGLISVRHALPTVYLMDFTAEDLQYFKAQNAFGSFDHLWPGDILVKRERQRFAASSDACFVVEITEREKNIPPIWDGPPNGFWRSHPHNHHNRQVAAVFRGV